MWVKRVDQRQDWKYELETKLLRPNLPKTSREKMTFSQGRLFKLSLYTEKITIEKAQFKSMQFFFVAYSRLDW